MKPEWIGDLNRAREALTQSIEAILQDDSQRFELQLDLARTHLQLVVKEAKPGSLVESVKDLQCRISRLEAEVYGPP